MKVLKHLPLVLAVLLATTVRAQLDVPLTDVSLAYPSLPPLTVQLGGTNRYILPTPFVLGGSFEKSALWICMDPLQTIFYNGSGQGPAAALHYQSQDPGLYDKWTPAAPGLDSIRLQRLADLFYVYAPTRNDSLIGGALALAVPEITNEFNANALTLSGGQFRAWGNTTPANAVVALAETMLARIKQADVAGKGNVKSLRFLIDGSYTNGSGTVPVQDLVGFIPVPEPSTYAIGTLALLVPLVGLRMRQRRHQASGPASAK